MLGFEKKIENRDDFRERVNEYPLQVWNTLYLGLIAKNYKFAHVISEFVDNSIANRFINSNTGKLEDLNINITIKEKSVKIIDDGLGQNEKNTAAVLDLGKFTDKSLSRFGLGIKQAGLWLGNHIWIHTKEFGEEEVHACELNLTNILAKPELITNFKTLVKSFSPYVVNGNDNLAEKNKHFFEICITDLKYEPTKYDVEYLKKCLGNTFPNYLRNHVNIFVNEIKVKIPRSPELIDLPTYKTKRVKFEFPDKGISGWWGITVKGTEGRSKEFGLNSYYNGRLVKSGDTHICSIGDDNTCKHALHPSFFRLDGEIFFTSPCILDGNIVSNKNDWMKNKDYEIVQSLLYENVAEKYTKELGIIAKEEKNNKKNLTFEKLGESAPIYLKKGFPELIQQRTEMVRSKEGEEKIEQISTQVRTQTDSHLDIDEDDNKNTGFQDKQNPRKPHSEIRWHRPIMIKGINYDVQVIQSDNMSDKDPRYVYTVQTSASKDKNNVLIITVNMNRQEVKMLEEDALIISTVEWITESIMNIFNDSQIVRSFISDREEKLSGIPFDVWINDVNEQVNLEKKKKRI